MNSKDNSRRTELTRKLVGAALCDFVAALSESKDAFIVGGQYPRERLLAEFRAWLLTRNFNVAGATDVGKQWMSLCDDGVFAGQAGDDKTPHKEPPTPEAKPLPPPAGPDGDPMKGDDWKADADKKDKWQDEGEDWKKGKEND